MRFLVQGETVAEGSSGLMWPISGAVSETGLSWPEALAFVQEMNARKRFGHDDWRLPNRRELLSLIDPGAREPALPPDHPFSNVWSGRYWTSTTFAGLPANAWWVQFSGGRMFYGGKTDDAMVWPVRGKSPVLYRTGQDHCFGGDGTACACAGTGQDGDVLAGQPWPEPRFRSVDMGVFDRMSRLVWARSSDLAKGPVNLEEARQAVERLSEETGQEWRLPEIHELELLVDCSRANPALPAGHPFFGLGDACWSATASGYEVGWHFCLYLNKGAVGVGHAQSREFRVWPVLDSAGLMDIDR